MAIGLTISGSPANRLTRKPSGSRIRSTARWGGSVVSWAKEKEGIVRTRSEPRIERDIVAGLRRLKSDPLLALRAGGQCSGSGDVFPAYRGDGRLDVQPRHEVLHRPVVAAH